MFQDHLQLSTINISSIYILSMKTGKSKYLQPISVLKCVFLKWYENAPLGSPFVIQIPTDVDWFMQIPYKDMVNTGVHVGDALKQQL